MPGMAISRSPIEGTKNEPLSGPAVMGDAFLPRQRGWEHMYASINRLGTSSDLGQLQAYLKIRNLRAPPDEHEFALKFFCQHDKGLRMWIGFGAGARTG